jgi:hypothetical protein
MVEGGGDVGEGVVAVVVTAVGVPTTAEGVAVALAAGDGDAATGNPSRT